MAIRVFNVSGSKQMTDTKDDPNVKLLAGGTIDLEGYHKIGNKMKTQIDAKLFKLREIKPGIPAPESTPDKKKAAPAKSKGKGIVQKAKDALGVGKTKPVIPPVDLKSLAASTVSNDNFIKAVMCHMIGMRDNLGRDGKPNQPVLEAIVKELRPSIKQVKADRRDRLYTEIKKEDASE